MLGWRCKLIVLAFQKKKKILKLIWGWLWLFVEILKTEACMETAAYDSKTDSNIPPKKFELLT